jgi:hypothetical protein
LVSSLFHVLSLNKYSIVLELEYDRFVSKRSQSRLNFEMKICEMTMSSCRSLLVFCSISMHVSSRHRRYDGDRNLVTTSTSRYISRCRSHRLLLGKAAALQHEKVDAFVIH